MALVKKGNQKIDKSVGIFNLPTSVCGTICKGCYARKAEIRFKDNVLKSRNENLEASQHIDFTDRMVSEIRKSKVKVFRIHESGDFYSDSYVMKWHSIAQQLPDVHFYGYSKKFNLYMVDILNRLDNVNIINSLTDHGFNYGDKEYCEKLVSEGYSLCPCVKGVKVICGKDCTLCHDKAKVCFLIH